MTAENEFNDIQVPAMATELNRYLHSTKKGMVVHDIDDSNTFVLNYKPLWSSMTICNFSAANGNLTQLGFFVMLSA